MLVLTVAKGPDRGAVFELRDQSDYRVVIGRNSPDLKLNDIMISRHHARLKCDGKRWFVRDLGSRNGTKLNGELLQKPTLLKTGDLIKTGYTEFAVRLVPEEAAEDAGRQGVNESRTTGKESPAEVAGAESSGFIDAAIASGEIPHDHAPAPVARAPKPPAFSSVPVVEPKAKPADAPAPLETPAPLEKIAPLQVPAPLDEPVSISASSVALTEELPDIEEPAPAVAEAKPAPMPVSPPAVAAPVAASPIERPANEWKSAIESQLVVIDKQGWDDLHEEEEEDGFIAAVTGSADDEEVQPLDDDERSQLYLDEDEHWDDDVPLDDDDLINSLKEDGPDALLRELGRTAPATAVAQSPAAKDEPAEESPATGGKAKKKRKK